MQVSSISDGFVHLPGIASINIQVNNKLGHVRQAGKLCNLVTGFISGRSLAAAAAAAMAPADTGVICVTAKLMSLPVLKPDKDT